MKVNQYSGKATSIPAGLILGLAVSLGLTLILSACLGLAIHLEKLQWENIGYGIMMMILISSYLGAFLSHRKIKRKKLAVCFLFGAIYYAALLSITALFFGGQFEGVGATGALILAGSGIAGLPERHNNKVGKGSAIKKAYC